MLGVNGPLAGGRPKHEFRLVADVRRMQQRLEPSEFALVALGEVAAASRSRRLPQTATVGAGDRRVLRDDAVEPTFEGVVVLAQAPDDLLTSGATVEDWLELRASAFDALQQRRRLRVCQRRVQCLGSCVADPGRRQGSSSLLGTAEQQVQWRVGGMFGETPASRTAYGLPARELRVAVGYLDMCLGPTCAWGPLAPASIASSSARAASS